MIQLNPLLTNSVSKTDLYACLCESADVKREENRINQVPRVFGMSHNRTGFCYDKESAMK